MGKLGKAIQKVFAKKVDTSSQGAILVKPSEAGLGEGKVSGQNVQVVGEVSKTTSGGMVSTGGGGVLSSIQTGNVGSKGSSSSGGGSKGNGSSGGGNVNIKDLSPVKQTQTQSQVTEALKTNSLTNLQKFEASKDLGMSSAFTQSKKDNFYNEIIKPKLGQGYSYFDKTTGKGYEVSPLGIKTETGTSKGSSSSGGGSKGINLIEQGNIKELIKGKTKEELSLNLSKKIISSDKTSKQFIFIKPEEQKNFPSKFDIISFTGEQTEDEGGQEYKSLSNFTDTLPAGDFVLSLKGTTSKVEEIGTLQTAERTPTGEYLYSGGASPLVAESPIKEIAINTGKGLAKVPLYTLDIGGTIGNVIMGKNVEFGKNLPSENLKGLKNTLNYDFEVSPFMDKDIQTAGIMVGATALSPTTTIGLLGLANIKPEITPVIKTAGRTISDFGQGLSEIPDLSINFPFQTKQNKITGKVLDVGGKLIKSVPELIPETPQDFLTFALFEKALTTKFVPKILKSTGLKTLGAKEGYSAFTNTELSEDEKYSKLLMSGMAIAGSVPEDIVLFRKARYKLQGKEKSDVGEFGIQKIDTNIGKENVKFNNAFDITTTKENPITIEYIPAQSEVFTNRIYPLKVLSEKVNFKNENEIRLPKTNEIQSGILDVVKEQGDIISGSFAQQTLIKESRNFKDLDIISKDPKQLSELIKQRLGDNVRIEKKTITDSPLGKFDIYKIYNKSGKHIADLDPIKYSEEGYAELFEPINVKGYKILPPEVRLVSKIIQQTRGLTREKKLKVALDIAQLTGRKELARSPSLLRGYGIPKSEQAKTFEGKDLYLTHAGLDVIPAFGEKVTLKEGDFFSTPSIVKEGKAFARKSRMGFKEPEYAGILDLLNKEERKNIKLYPSARNVLIEKARLKKGEIEIPDISSTEIEAIRKVPEGGKEFKIEKRIKTILEGEPVEIAYVKDVSKRIKAKINIKDKLNKEKSKTNKYELELNDLLKEQDKIKESKERVSERNTEKILRLPETLSRISPRKLNRNLDLEFIRTNERKIKRDIPREVPRDIPREDTRTTQRDIPREVLRDITRSPTRNTPREVPRDIPRIVPKTNKELLKFDIDYLKPTKKQTKGESYDVYVKDLKRKSYTKVTKKPVALQTAKDQQSFFTDNSVARTSFLKKRKQQPSPSQYDIPSGYYESNKNKFRDWNQRKGKRNQLQNNKIIEFSKNAIDTQGEKKQLSIFKLMKQRELKRIKKLNQPSWNFA